MAPGDLYDLDFHAWALGQAARLHRLHQMGLPAGEGVDLDLIADEIEDLGHEQRFQVEANLVQAMMLLIEATAQPQVASSRTWTTKMRACLDAASDRYTPSMATSIDLGQIWHKALVRSRRSLQEDGIRLPQLPEGCPFDLATLVAWDGDLPKIVAALGRNGRPYAGHASDEAAQPGAAGPT